MNANILSLSRPNEDGNGSRGIAPCLFEAVQGSWLYGTETINSDIDKKLVYLPDLHTLILARKKIWESSQTSNNKGYNGKANSDTEETEHMSLHKFLKLAQEGQTIALDMAFTPENKWLESSDIWKELVTHKKDFITKNIISFLRFAKGQSIRYSNRGYKINKIKKVIEVLDNFHPEGLLIDSLEDFKSILIKEKILEDKYVEIAHQNNQNVGETYLKVCDKMYTANSKVKALIKNLEFMLGQYGERAHKAADENNYDYKAISHAFRTTIEAEELATTNNLIFPLKQKDYIRDIKLGKYSGEELIEKLTSEIERVSVILETLPEKGRCNWDSFIIACYDDKGLVLQPLVSSLADKEQNEMMI